MYRILTLFTLLLCFCACRRSEVQGPYIVKLSNSDSMALNYKFYLSPEDYMSDRLWQAFRLEPGASADLVMPRDQQSICFDIHSDDYSYSTWPGYGQRDVSSILLYNSLDWRVSDRRSARTYYMGNTAASTYWEAFDEIRDGVSMWDSLDRKPGDCTLRLDKDGRFELYDAIYARTYNGDYGVSYPPDGENVLFLDAISPARYIFDQYAQDINTSIKFSKDSLAIYYGSEHYKLLRRVQ